MEMALHLPKHYLPRLFKGWSGGTFQKKCLKNFLSNFFLINKAHYNNLLKKEYKPEGKRKYSKVCLVWGLFVCFHYHHHEAQGISQKLCKISFQDSFLPQESELHKSCCFQKSMY